MRSARAAREHRLTILAGLGLAAGLLVAAQTASPSSPKAETGAAAHQGGAAQLVFTDVRRQLTVPPGGSAARTLLCPRGRVPLGWSFKAFSQTGAQVSAARLAFALAVRRGARAGWRLGLRSGATVPVPATLSVTCIQGRRGLATRLAPPPAARNANARRPAPPTLTVGARTKSVTVQPGQTVNTLLLCRAGALLGDHGYTERGATRFLGAALVQQGRRSGFRGRFENRGASPTRVTFQILCADAARLRVNVQDAATATATETARAHGNRMPRLIVHNAECNGQEGPGAAPDGTIARGYITVDNAQQCSLVLPQNDGWTYTTPAEATPLSPNLLWGDWFIVQDERAIGDNLVHIEAANQRLPVLPNDPNLPTNPNATGYTFYGRYVTSAGGLNIDDKRPRTPAPPFVP